MTKITLTYNTPVRAAAWGDIFFARVWTLSGSIAERGGDYVAALARARANGHEVVGTIYTGAMLLGDRELAQRRNADLRAEVARAVTLKTGDEVEIDGVAYVVRFAPRNETGFAPVNSDPIAFLPVGSR